MKKDKYKFTKMQKYRAGLFEMTRERINTSPFLLSKTMESIERTEVISIDDIDVEVSPGSGHVKINCERFTTIDGTLMLASSLLPWTGGLARVGILNFASGTTPGGGVINGTSAQEESLCRQTTLYPSLASKIAYDKFYSKNIKENTGMYIPSVIYTPDVYIIKPKDDDRFYNDEHCIPVNVISCAAPNIRRLQSSHPELCKPELIRWNLDKKIDLIFRVAASKNIRMLVLGAFGCGAFRNDPDMVADIFIEKIDKYRRYLDIVCFAISTKNAHDDMLYYTFSKKIEMWDRLGQPKINWQW